MVTKKPPPKISPPTGDMTRYPTRSGRAAARPTVPPIVGELAAWAAARPEEADPRQEETTTAPAIVDDAAATAKDSSVPHASASAGGDGEKTAEHTADSPPAKPGSDGKKKVGKKNEISPHAKPGSDGKKKADETAGAASAKRKGSAVKESSRQPKKKKVGSISFHDKFSIIVI